MPNPLPDPFYVYVDVDDTFVRSFGKKRIPMPAVIEHIRQLHRQGAHLYCWSSGGATYALESAREVGIEPCFEAFLPKPHLMIDDQPVAEWKLCLERHPAELRNSHLLEYWDELGHRSAPALNGMNSISQQEPGGHQGPRGTVRPLDEGG